jgi:hypothetical protein
MKLAFWTAVGLAACTVGSASAAAPKAKTGATAIAQSIIKAQLIDPYSVKFEGVVEKAGVDRAGKATRLVCGTYNAKNRLGGYTGAKSFVYPASKEAVFTSSGERLEKSGSRENLDDHTNVSGNDLDSLGRSLDASIAGILGLGDEVKFWLQQC